jgi:uncharacterized membrane protein
MKLQDYKLVFASVGLIGVLLIATPALGAVIRLPSGDQFSELYLLGPGHMAEKYPFNIEDGQNYSIYVGVGNHLGSSAYYVLYVKLGNQTDPLPNATLGTPSSLQPLYEYRFSIQDNTNWESNLNFSVSNASISGNNSQINTLQINNITFNVVKPAIWDSNSVAFKYQLLFELWIYSLQTGSVEFNNRYVNLQINLKQTN